MKWVCSVHPAPMGPGQGVATITGLAGVGAGEEGVGGVQSCSQSCSKMGRRRERETSSGEVRGVRRAGVRAGVGEAEDRERESKSPARDSTGLTGGVSSPRLFPSPPRFPNPTVSPSSSPRGPDSPPHPGKRVKSSKKDPPEEVGEPWREAGGEGDSAEGAMVCVPAGRGARRSSALCMK